jgi:hypothetical protein
MVDIGYVMACLLIRLLCIRCLIGCILSRAEKLADLSVCLFVIPIDGPVPN